MRRPDAADRQPRLRSPSQRHSLRCSAAMARSRPRLVRSYRSRCRMVFSAHPWRGRGTRLAAARAMVHVLTRTFRRPAVAPRASPCPWVQRGPPLRRCGRAAAAMDVVGSTAVSSCSAAIRVFATNRLAPLRHDWTQLCPTTSRRAATARSWSTTRRATCRALWRYGRASVLSRRPRLGVERRHVDAGDAGRERRSALSLRRLLRLARSRVVMVRRLLVAVLRTPNSQTFEYDGATWTQIATTATRPRAGPSDVLSRRLGRAACSAVRRFRIDRPDVLYNGASSTGYSSDSGPETSPATLGPRYDSLHDLCILMVDFRARTCWSDTWAFDAALDPAGDRERSRRTTTRWRSWRPPARS
jgi:hypothetical protein